MQIAENAPTKELTIQGLSFTVPVVVNASDITGTLAESCDPEVAAKMLQQTFAENWRNNFAPKVNKALKAAASSLEIEFKKIADLDDEDAQALNDAIDNAALQNELDEYITAYVPGVRRAAAGPALSPVDRESNKLAVDMVRDHLETALGVGRTARSESYKIWDAKVQEEMNMTGADYIAQLAEQLLEANPSIRETAQANIDARKRLAENVELNFG